MCFRASLLTVGAMLSVLCTIAIADQTPSGTTPDRTILQATLTAPGSPSFHLKATIDDKQDPDFRAEIEIFWMAPDKWRRTIQSPEFSQTLIVNGGKAFEQDSDDYFPLSLQTFVNAMFDPRPLLDALRPEDRLETQANRDWRKPPFCGNPNIRLPLSPSIMEMACHQGPFKSMETVYSPGHPVMFADYKTFMGRPVARLVISSSRQARVVEFSELKKPEASLFSIEQPTPKEKQIHSVYLPEADLRSMAAQALDIIWPQVLDGPITGPSSYYVSIDRTGQVRETVSLQTANERANDSAVRQIMKWKFNPVMKDGAPVQAEAILTFITNTRAYGPPDPLTEAEVRKLATNMVEPIIPPGTPVGATCSERIAIDEEGNLIEEIAGGCGSGLTIPCYEALKKWHFAPFLENGQPRPYRGEITCKAPNPVQN